MHGNPNKNVAEVYEQLVACLPSAEVWAELPLFSEGNQGRAQYGAHFLSKKQGDLNLDLIVQSAEKLLYAVEVCGKHNLSADGKNRADKK